MIPANLRVMIAQNDGGPPLMSPREMTDDQLVEAWDKVEDGDNLSDFEAAVIAEIERRNIDL